MATDYFETVTALEGHRNEAMKRRAGVEPDKKKDDDKKLMREASEDDGGQAAALKEIDDERFDLHREGRRLMKENRHNTPEYDTLVKRSKELRRKQFFIEDSMKKK
jgi:hypothetical protein